MKKSAHKNLPLLFWVAYLIYDNFITSLNARNADVLTWETIKGPLIEEYLKKKERKELPDDALLSNTRNGKHWNPRNNNYNNHPNNLKKSVQ